MGSRIDIYPAPSVRGAAGPSLLVKSSDPIELSGLCDRVLVMSRGTIVEEIPGDELDEVRIVEAIVRSPGMSKATRSPLRRGDAQVPDQAGHPVTAVIQTTRVDRARQVARKVARNARDRTNGARSSRCGCGCRSCCRCC